MQEVNDGPSASAAGGPLPPAAEPFSADLTVRIAAAVAARGPGYVPRTRHRLPAADGTGVATGGSDGGSDGGTPGGSTGAGAARFTNRLALETSPYLLQHAHNPVNWYPWGEEAFADARRLGRPVFLSIGYSTCHWCHVMEEESFEDAEIAAFMNANYICIKVDREERPDVDAVYMSAVQRLTGSGGWPMSVWMNAAREPFFGGTYFPPRDGARGSRHGFLTLLTELRATFDGDPDRVRRAAQSLVAAVRQDMEGQRAGTAAGTPAAAPGDQHPGLSVIYATVDYFKRAFDRVHGGVNRAPKFPSNIPVRLLLRHHRRTGDTDALHMAVLTLQKMAGGGLYDQLGGGFHRYSTDAVWLAPHFEKMLYDNALLVVAYAEAFQVTGRPEFVRIVRETCDYVLREMTDPAGGFYSATDADSEGDEGRFFVWRDDEVRHELGAAGFDADTVATFVRHYDVRPEGNWEGHTILNVPSPDEATTARLAPARAHLYAVRAKRIPPLRDDKILAAWNGLMLSAMAVAGRVLSEPRYVAAAMRAADFMTAKLRDPQGRLYRTYKDGRAHTLGFLDDHAFVVAGLLDLYETTLDPRFLFDAVALGDHTERLFADPAGGWFMTSPEHETLIARERPAYDGAEPSGTSVALMNAARLAVLTDGAGANPWRDVVTRALTAHAETLRDRPIVMTEALLALDFVLGDPRQIAIVWPDDPGDQDPEDPARAGQPSTDAGTAALRGVLDRMFLPARVVAGGSETAARQAAAAVPFLRDKIARAGQPTAYVCHQGNCDLPVTDATAFAAQLTGGANRPSS